MLVGLGHVDLVCRDLERNLRRSWRLIAVPNLLGIAGAFFLGFGVLVTIAINNAAALAVLAHSLLPFRKLADAQADEAFQQELFSTQVGPVLPALRSNAWTAVP